MKYKHIAVEGNIGAGKTTLTKFLSSILDASTLLEEFEENKFLKAFYNTGEFAFQSEIQFLLDRSKQLNEFYKKNHSLIISDYYVNKSLIFSKINLNEYEFQLLKNLHGHLFGVLPPPDLLIFLDRSLDVLFANIMRRNRPYEKNMDLNYLKKLDHYYENWLEGLHFKNCFGKLFLEIGHNLDPDPPQSNTGINTLLFCNYLTLNYSLSIDINLV